MPDPKFNALFFGNWGLGRAGLEGLLAAQSVQVSAVFTKFKPGTDDPFLNQVHDYAVSRELPCINTASDFCPKPVFFRRVQEYGNIDFIVSCCFDRILSGEILAQARVAAINLHGALLPRQRGLKPLEHAIICGDACGGVTLHEMTTGVDDGDIILQDGSLKIRSEDTYGNLFERQCRMTARLMERFFLEPNGYLARKQKQDHSAATTAPRLPFLIEQTDTVEIIRAKFKRGLPEQTFQS